MLSVDGLRKYYDGIRAVDGITFTIEAEAITTLIGPNGAGKTTLFDLISGFASPDSGSVALEGTDVTHLPPHERAGLGMIRTFQQPRTITRLTVRENLAVAAPDHPGERLAALLIRGGASRRREAAVAERVDGYIELFGLERVADDLAGTLSGGQRKLLEMARALMAEPRLLLLDEPLAGVNPTLARRLEELILRLRDEFGLTVLLIEHDLPAVMRISDRVIALDQGRVIATGSPGDVRSHPAVIDAYLGSDR